MKKSTIRNKRKFKVENYNPEEQLKKQRKFMSITYTRNVKLTIVSVFALLIIAVSGSYAYLSSVQKSEKYNTLTSGTLKVDFDNTGEGMGDVINLNGAYPESDSDGLNEQPYTFKITNTGSINASYKVSILDDQEMIEEDHCSENLLPKDKIRVSIDGGEAFTLSAKEVDSYVVATGTLNANNSKVHNVRVWIDINSGNEVLGKHYHGKIKVDTVNTTDNDNIPVTDFKVGDYVYMVPTSTSYTPSTDLNSIQFTGCNGITCDPGTVNPSELRRWIIIKNDSTGIEMISESISSSTITFYGDKGYENYTQALNEVTAQYENSEYTNGSRCIGYYSQTLRCSNYLSDDCDDDSLHSNDTNSTNGLVYKTIESVRGNSINPLIAYIVSLEEDNKYMPSTKASPYWIASRISRLNTGHNYYYYGGYYINSVGEITSNNGIYKIDAGGTDTEMGSSSLGRRIRPILKLKSNVVADRHGNGWVENPWVLVSN